MNILPLPYFHLDQLVQVSGHTKNPLPYDARGIFSVFDPVVFADEQITSLRPHLTYSTKYSSLEAKKGEAKIETFSSFNSKLLEYGRS